jgi:ketosteroid isomerase-like protein
MRLRPSLWLGVLLVVGGLVLLVERVIVTDAEAVEALVQRAAEAVREGDFEALAATLGAGFTVEGRTGKEALDWIRKLRRNYRPLGIDAEVGEVEVSEDRAVAPTVVSMTVMARPVHLRAAVHCRRAEDGWRITAAILEPGLP